MLFCPGLLCKIVVVLSISAVVFVYVYRLYCIKCKSLMDILYKFLFRRTLQQPMILFLLVALLWMPAQFQVQHVAACGIVPSGDRSNCSYWHDSIQNAVFPLSVRVLSVLNAQCLFNCCAFQIHLRLCLGMNHLEGALQISVPWQRYFYPNMQWRTVQSLENRILMSINSLLL